MFANANADPNKEDPSQSFRRKLGALVLEACFHLPYCIQWIGEPHHILAVHPDNPNLLGLIRHYFGQRTLRITQTFTMKFIFLVNTFLFYFWSLEIGCSRYSLFMC